MAENTWLSLGFFHPQKGGYRPLLISDMGTTSHVKNTSSKAPRNKSSWNLSAKKLHCRKDMKKARRFWIDIQFSVSVDVVFPYRHPKRPLIWRCWIDFIAFQPDICLGVQTSSLWKKSSKDAYLMVSIIRPNSGGPPASATIAMLHGWIILGRHGHTFWSFHGHCFWCFLLRMGAWMGAWLFSRAAVGLTNFTKHHEWPQKGFISKKRNMIFLFSHNHEGVPPTHTTQNMFVDQNR